MVSDGDGLAGGEGLLSRKSSGTVFDNSPCVQNAAVSDGGGLAGGEGLLSRKSSGNVYDNFPCVRVGDYDLPSSMDLRQYLDEMQEVGDWEGDPLADLPTIPDDEVSDPIRFCLQYPLPQATFKPVGAFPQ